MSYSDNAIMAKVRALYGKRLGTEDYSALCACHSVGEITGYLKARTVYSGVLASAREDLIQRGQLETLIRRRVLFIYTSLARFSYDDRLFVDLYVSENEITELLQLLRLLNADATDRYIVSLPVYLAKFTHIDLFSLAKIRTFDQLLDGLKRSEYYDIIGHFRPLAGGQVDIVGCEKALLTHHYAKFISRVEKNYAGKTREDLLRLLYRQIDFYNLGAVFRLKRYYNYTPDELKNDLIDLKSNLSPALREKLINAADADELAAILKNHRTLSAILPQGKYDPVLMITQTERLKVRLAQKPFRFSQSPMVVVLSYMTLLEIEILNLINIIEGVRYGIPGDEIHKLLVIMH